MTTFKDLVREFISAVNIGWRKAKADPDAFVAHFLTQHHVNNNRLEQALLLKMREASKCVRESGLKKLEEVFAVIKKNRGRKISLAAADRQYSSFLKRVEEVNANKKYGMEIPLVILCGSYLRREPSVGDIDVVTLFTRRPSFADRERQLLRTKRAGNIIEQIFAVEFDVRRQLQHRSTWIHQVPWEEFSQLKCDYRIVHAHGEYEALVNRLRTSPRKLITMFEKLRVSQHQLHNR